MEKSIGNEDVARIVQAFAIAALDPSQWLPAMSLMSDALGAVCCGLELTDLNTGAVHMECSIDFEEDVLQHYEERVFHINPRVERGMALPLGFVGDDRHVMTMDDPNSPEFLDWLARTPYHYIQGGKILDANGHVGFFASHYSKKHGPPDKLQERVHQTLFPHLVNFVEVGRALNAGGLHNALIRDEDLNTGKSFALLDRRGRIAEASQGFEAAFKRSGLLACRDGRLIAFHARHRQTVELFLKSALDRTALLEPAASIRLASPERPKGIVLRAVPLPPNGNVFDVFAPAALITLTDLDLPYRARRGELMILFGLTGREAEVAAMVGEGRTIEQVAHSLSISLYTAKQHLKGIFGKMEVSRQAELVGIVARLG